MERANYSGRSPYNVACGAVFAAVKEMLPKVSKKKFAERTGLVSERSLAEVWRGAFKAVAEGGGGAGREAEGEPPARELAACPRAQARLDEWA